jgi:hypothetical protein
MQEPGTYIFQIKTDNYKIIIINFKLRFFKDVWI